MAKAGDSESSKSKFELFGDKIFEYIVEQARNGFNHLYPQQLSAVLQARGFLDASKKESVRRPFIIEAREGSGKTGIMCILPYILKCSKVLFLPDKCWSSATRKCFESGDETNFLVKIGVVKLSDIHGYLEAPLAAELPLDCEKLMAANVVVLDANIFGFIMTDINEKEQKFLESFSTVIVPEAHLLSIQQLSGSIEAAGGFIASAKGHQARAGKAYNRCFLLSKEVIRLMDTVQQILQEEPIAGPLPLKEYNQFLLDKKRRAAAIMAQAASLDRKRLLLLRRARSEERLAGQDSHNGDYTIHEYLEIE